MAAKLAVVRSVQFSELAVQFSELAASREPVRTARPSRWRGSQLLSSKTGVETTSRKGVSACQSARYGVLVVGVLFWGSFGVTGGGRSHDRPVGVRCFVGPDAGRRVTSLPGPRSPSDRPTPPPTFPQVRPLPALRFAAWC